jgi:C4-dicarboxylate-specific signal transduction histidine kinase
MDDRRAIHTCIGSVLACFTHEMQNHLATIHEAAGLLEDMAGGGRPIDPKKVTRLSGMTSRHVSSALGLIRYLNRCAHRLDQEISSFSVNDVIDELLALTRRKYRQNMVEVRTAFHAGLQEIRSSSAHLQSLLFCVLERVLHSLPEEGIVAVSTHPSNGAVRIVIALSGDLREGLTDPGVTDDSVVCILATVLGVTVTMTPDRKTVSLHVPSIDQLVRGTQ